MIVSYNIIWLKTIVWIFYSQVNNVYQGRIQSIYGEGGWGLVKYIIPHSLHTPGPGYVPDDFYSL